MIVTTLKIGAVYSPASDSARKIGRNATAVVNDEVRSGIRSSLAESTAARRRSFPAAICTMIDSVMTIALSTSMPSAMISAASDIWSSPMSRKLITRIPLTMAIGIRLATISPVRRPSVTSMTSVTIAMACSRLPTNSSILRSTASGWNWTRSNSMPMGKLLSRRSIPSRMR